MEAPKTATQPSLLDPQPPAEAPAPAVPVVSVQTIPPPVAATATETAIAKKERAPQHLAPVDPTMFVDSSHPMAGYLNPAMFNQCQRAANLMAQSQLVPAHYQGRVADVFIAIQTAIQMQINPMMFMQNSYIVKGRPGIEAKLTIALINASGRFSDPLQWELSGTGRDRKAVCFAHLKSTGKRVEIECTMAQAEAEGWVNKDGSKWKTIPDMMLRYRSATFFGRLYAPDVTMGFRTVEELEDIVDAAPVEEAPRLGNAGTKAALGIAPAAEGK